VADGVSDGLPWAVPDRDRNQTHLRHNDAATGRPGRPAPGIGAARDCTQVTAIAHLRGTGSLREPSEVVALRSGVRVPSVTPGQSVADVRGLHRESYAGNFGQLLLDQGPGGGASVFVVG
jgi:hypothetical protein